MHLRFIFLHESKSGTSKGKIQGKTEYVVVGTLDDRSFLSDEMAAMCTKLPIYRIKQKNPRSTVSWTGVASGENREYFKPKDDKRELRRSKKKAAWPSG